MRSLHWLAAVAIYAASALASEDESLSKMRVPFERGSKVPPVVSVFLDLGYGGIGRKHPQAVIACIWSDGRAIWSRDRSRGSPPYLTAQIDPKRIAEFINELHEKGIFDRKLWYEVGVDAAHHDVNIFDGPKRVALRGSGYYTNGGKAPEHVSDVPDAFVLFRMGLERLLPRQGQQLRDVAFEFRTLTE